MKTLIVVAALFLSVSGLFAQNAPAGGLSAGKREERPVAFLGIAMDTSRGDGVRVEYVEPGSPAARAGVEKGAIIFGICGLPVRGVMAQVSQVMASKKPGDEIELRWCKDEKVTVSKITLGSRTNTERLAKAAEGDRMVAEAKVRMNRGNEETKRHIGELAIVPRDAAAEKRARLEEEIRKAEEEAARLQERAAKLREELRKVSDQGDSQR
jgi:C-terminal processing protease CtpA/Prc